MAEPRGHTLLTDMLRVANRAIEAHASEPPWRELAERTAERASPSFGVAMFEDDPDVAVDQCAVRVHEGRLEVVSRGPVPAVDWRVSVDFLRNVARSPDDYVADPRKLELGWLLRRLDIPG